MKNIHTPLYAINKNMGKLKNTYFNHVVYYLKIQCVRLFIFLGFVAPPAKKVKDAKQLFFEQELRVFQHTFEHRFPKTTVTTCEKEWVTLPNLWRSVFPLPKNRGAFPREKKRLAQEYYNQAIPRFFYHEDQYRDLLEETFELRKNGELLQTETAWKKKFVFVTTPVYGNICLFYDFSIHTFCYYCDNKTIPYYLLNACAMRFVVQLQCRDLFLDTQYLPQPSALQNIADIEVVNKNLVAHKSKEYTKKTLLQKLAQPLEKKKPPATTAQNRFKYVGHYREFALYLTPKKISYQQNNFKPRNSFGLCPPPVSVVAPRKEEAKMDYASFAKNRVATTENTARSQKKKKFREEKDGGGDEDCLRPFSLAYDPDAFSLLPKTNPFTTPVDFFSPEPASDDEDCLRPFSLTYGDVSTYNPDSFSLQQQPKTNPFTTPVKLRSGPVHKLKRIAPPINPFALKNFDVSKGKVPTAPHREAVAPKVYVVPFLASPPNSDSTTHNHRPVDHETKSPPTTAPFHTAHACYATNPPFPPEDQNTRDTPAPQTPHNLPPPGSTAP